MYIKEVTIN